MKFSEHWLREWVNPPVTSEVLCEQLTMAGLEVDSVEPAAPPFSGVVVGKVLTVAPHPDADRLRVCQVNVGEGLPIQIVCGAANVAEGMSVPTARIGAYLPGDFKIKRSKLRGVVSEGMLCSAKELGLAESSEGLMPLPDHSLAGQDVRDFLDLDDNLIEVDLTPNRSDCLSVAGIAREAGVLNRCTVTEQGGGTVAATIDDSFAIAVEAPEACPRYLGRVIRGIDAQAETPDWLQERLRRSGLRSLGPAVDVTNYVLLELGQPLHAFDLAKLQGTIRVRMARTGEALTLLDGQTIELRDDSLVIADDREALALAGIMGGQGSAVTESTQDIFLECAFFAPEAIAGKARSYGLHTDSSHRFERGVDHSLQTRAIERATALLVEIAGGDAGPVSEVCSDAHLPQRQTVVLRRQQIKRLLGATIADGDVADILQRLGMQVAAQEGGWRVTPPSFRFDINIEADLIEEVGRIHGYNRLPSSRFQGALAMHAEPEGRRELKDLRRILVSRGYQEAITYSFVDPDMQALITPEDEAIRLANPLSSEMSVMRTSLWTGLLKTLVYNQNRQQARIRLFESGLRFVRQGDDIVQERMISGIAAGGVDPEQWGKLRSNVDFYDLKGDVEALIALTADSGFSFTADSHPALHPGQCARLGRHGEAIGWLGALNPALVKHLGLNGPAYLFEIKLDAITTTAVPAFAELSRYPSIRRDLAIVVGKNVPAQSVSACIRDAAKPHLVNLELFDVYEGEHIESDKKSLALGLILQDQTRTLIDSDVEAVVSRVLDKLKQELDAILRS